jgi:predicted methyltransferase
MQQIDEFLEYLFLIEENSTTLNTDQVKKLELIKNKVSEIVKKVETYTVSAVIPTQPLLAESQVVSFSDYQEINEMIKKRGNKWVVTDKSGKKVLGTHPSREKALKQLQAIEISKMGK